ncbi:MAG: TlpA disulfide reductase family protein [Phycisphaerales bacterium]
MKNRRPAAWITGVCLVISALCGPAHAAPPGEQLADKMFNAYQDLDQYDATVHLAMRQLQGKWTSSLEGDVHIVLDRANNRLRVEFPDQLLVSDGKTLYYNNDGMPGKHLAISVPAEIDYPWLVEQVPSMSFPFGPIDLVLLLSDDLPSFLAMAESGEPAMIQPDPDDPAQRPRVQLGLPMGVMTLTLDPKTNLVQQAALAINPASAAQYGGQGVVYTFDFKINSTDQPIDDDRFAFDTAGSVASPSMQHMMASGSNAPHPLTGKPTPELKLPDIDGNEHDIAVDDADAKVIVLDFWATWCGPCVAALPELQEVYDWAKAEGKSVAIYAVNQGETVDEVKQFWADKGLSIPVLMDENFTSAQSYQVNGIPQTVVICGGKVQQVHVGYGPGMAGRLKAEIETLLAE